MDWDKLFADIFKYERKFKFKTQTRCEASKTFANTDHHLICIIIQLRRWNWMISVLFPEIITKTKLNPTFVITEFC